jgi:CubicO group peptidase (beta-lactamase class C family)
MTPCVRLEARAVLSVAFGIFLLGPGLAAQETRIWPVPEWTRAAPEDHGLDADRLADLVQRIDSDEYRHIHSLLVVRNGHLVLEEYFHGYDPGRLHMQQSVSKSFTSALIGIARDRGDIESVDERVVDFFPSRRTELARDERRRTMRVEDLLTMRSGTDYHERGSSSPHAQLNRLSRGWDTFILSRPMVRDPGSFFQYDSGGVILLSSLLHARTGMHADDYAARYLFEPLGIEAFNWFENADGHPHTGGGLDLRPRDMARFGLLYLRRGVWNGERVISEEWIDRSFTRHVTFSSPRSNRTEGYGYLWWILPPSPNGGGEQDIYAAMGFRGQFIFVIPEHDMVVVVTAGTRQYRDEVKPIEFLYSHVLPAIGG